MSIPKNKKSSFFLDAENAIPQLPGLTTASDRRKFIDLR